VVYNRKIGYITEKKGVDFMASSAVSKPKEKIVKSKFNEEFDNYLKKQCLKTTFNGLELETFSWYKKVLTMM